MMDYNGGACDQHSASAPHPDHPAYSVKLPPKYGKTKSPILPALTACCDGWQQIRVNGMLLHSEQIEENGVFTNKQRVIAYGPPEFQQEMAVRFADGDTKLGKLAADLPGSAR